LKNSAIIGRIYGEGMMGKELEADLGSVQEGLGRLLEAVLLHLKGEQS